MTFDLCMAGLGDEGGLFPWEPAAPRDPPPAVQPADDDRHHPSRVICSHAVKRDPSTARCLVCGSIAADLDASASPAFSPRDLHRPSNRSPQVRYTGQPPPPPRATVSPSSSSVHTDVSEIVDLTLPRCGAATAAADHHDTTSTCSSEQSSTGNLRSSPYAAHDPRSRHHHPAPGPALGSPPPAPSAYVHHAEGDLSSQDATALHYNSWTLLHGEAKGMVLVVHDFATHALRCARHVVPALVAQHFSVVAVDLRGHGGSERRRPTRRRSGRIGVGAGGTAPGAVSDVDADEARVVRQEWARDIATVLRGVKKRTRALEGLPVVVYGDGFGGSIALEFGLALERDDAADLNLRGFVCSGALLGNLYQGRDPLEVPAPREVGSPVSPTSKRGRSPMPTPPSPSAFIMRTLSDIASVLQITDRPNSVLLRDCGLEPLALTALSRDLRVAEMVRHDARRVEKVSAATAEAARQLVSSVTQRADQWRFPLALLHGEADCFAKPVHAEEFAATACAMFRVYRGARHWLHHEIQPTRSEFLADLCAFCDALM